MIFVGSRNSQPYQIERKFPGATVIDVTSRAPEPWVRFSPFFPHGNLPIPLWPGKTAASVEGIWQGLKRFELEDHICEATLQNETMLKIKRGPSARRGRVLGHQAGADEATLLDFDICWQQKLTAVSD